MAMRGRRASRPRGPKPKYLWTTALLDQFATATTVTNVEILQASDWERSSASFERATLVRVRGWMAFRVTSLAANSLFMYVGLYDEDEASSLADVVATYDSEDILWTGGIVTAATGLSEDNTKIMKVDVKVARKITSAMHLRMVFTASNSNNIVVSGVLRACIKYT